MNIDDCKFVGVLGEGYFSVVKKYVHLESGEFVAIKELKKMHFDRDDYRYRFLREIKLLNELFENEHIIEVLGNQNLVDQKRLYYIMPIASTNLYKYIKTYNNALSKENRIHIFDQILDAIKFAHDKSILHRDIAPNNMLVFEDDGQIKIKVSDFGLGKNLESLSYYTHSSTSNYGQILYISPQQRDFLKDANFGDDLYALGKLLYFIITGKDPIHFQSCDFSTLINKATEEDSSKRYQIIGEFWDHYESLKKLIFTEEIPEKYLILKDFIQMKESINWLRFHEIALQANEVSHIYYDYIEPIIEIFSDSSNLNSYYTAVGNSIIDFIEVFIEKLHDCYCRTGWPFGTMNNFGNFLYELLIIIEEKDGKLLCLREIWYLAHEVDQWAVQSKMQNIFKKRLITSDIEIAFAQYVTEYPGTATLEHYEDVNLPPKVRLALIKISEERSE